MPWGDLNKRQQTYLRAVYEVDQLTEAAVRSESARTWNRTPASEWRWLPYNLNNTPLLRRIREAGYRDQGTGSTFEALERRGLVECRYERGSLGTFSLYVQITKDGRKLVRDALGVKPTPKLAVGTLQEWHWRALCRAYTLDGKGMPYDKDTGDGFGYVSWKSVLRLRDYKIGGEEYPLIKDGGNGITPFGIGYYERSWQRYHDLYPNVEAKPPKQQVDPYEPFIEIIQTDRGCRACQGRYLVALTRTYQQSEKWVWSVSEQEQRIAGKVKSHIKIEQCVCQESDIQEVHAPLLAILDQLVTQGWQLHFPYHNRYDLGYLVSGRGGLYQDIKKDWYEPDLVREKLLPLMRLPDEEENDERNVMKSGEMLYCVNEHTGRGAIYLTILGALDTRPVALTRPTNQGYASVLKERKRNDRRTTAKGMDTEE